MANKRAAFEEIEDKALGEISAADFLEALVQRKELKYLYVLPEKKKLELEVEPVFPKIRVKDIIDIVRGEKKKREYEVDDLKIAVREVDWDPTRLVINPVEPLIDQLENILVDRLRTKGLIK